MSARSFVIQLQPGVGQAILPDHRKMVPGQNYIVDSETFSKISLGARQSVIKVVSVSLDTPSAYTTAAVSGNVYPAQVSTGVNNMAAGSGINAVNVLTSVATSLSAASFAGFAAQGWDASGPAGSNTGVGFITPSGASGYSQTLVGSDGARYNLVFNGTGTTISGGWTTVWVDEINHYVGVAASGGAYTVKADGLGTPYVISSNTSLSGTSGLVTTVGTRVGAFAGVTLVDLPAGYYGWVQIEGTCPRVAVVSGLAAGSTVGVSQSSSVGLAIVPANLTASVANNGTVSGTALANNVFGTTLTAAASGTSTGQYFAVVDIRSRRVKKPYVRVLNKN